jgi:uncharacterized protein YndB with AHSA1/START domain
MANKSADSARALTITRVFDAPRRLVFAAWTEPEHLLRWSAPHGFRVTHSSGELRVGGAWRACMIAPDGAALWLSGVYREIVRDEKLVFTHAWDEDDGRPGPQTLVTMILNDLGGKTEMIFRQEGFVSDASRDGHEGGWSQGFERLAELLGELVRQGASNRSER